MESIWGLSREELAWRGGLSGGGAGREAQRKGRTRRLVGLFRFGSGEGGDEGEVIGVCNRIIKRLQVGSGGEEDDDEPTSIVPWRASFFGVSIAVRG